MVFLFPQQKVHVLGACLNFYGPCWSGLYHIHVVCDEGRHPALADVVDEHESFTTDLLPVMQVVDAGFLSRL